MIPQNDASTAKPIFLLTDFGTADHYVAAMKAVILARCPWVQLIDVSHQVHHQAVAQGCYLLEALWSYLPEPAIVLAVVDPGVGTERQPAVFADKGRLAVGPNNGLFSFLPTDTPGRVLDKPQFWLPRQSHTFHGRDIFAPCVAHLAAGLPWTELGDTPVAPIKLANDLDPAARMTMSGRIIHFDQFGNAVSNISGKIFGDLPAGRLAVEVPGKLRCEIGRTYGDVADGRPLAYVGSTGRVEIAVRNGSARDQLGLTLNDGVEVVRLSA